MKNIVSIIVPIYNAESYLEKCLNSIINQTYQNIEHLIVDGASQDGTLDIIQKYHISFQDSILEIGCGEGRDARAVLEKGYNLLATDISKEAIEYCKKQFLYTKIILKF